VTAAGAPLREEAAVDITVDHRPGGIAVVRPLGRLDVYSAAELRPQLIALVAAGHSRLVVDLTGVAFLDSSGVGALISGLKAARAAGGGLRIVSPHEQAHVVLRMAMLHQVLPPYATEAEALAGL
jgi:anti-sigma B factor antagonist